MLQIILEVLFASLRAMDFPTTFVMWLAINLMPK